MDKGSRLKSTKFDRVRRRSVRTDGGYRTLGGGCGCSVLGVRFPCTDM